jgi:uncharacterized protein YcaQ
MSSPAPTPDTVSTAQVAAFRLARHYLDAPATSSLVNVCGDVCGVQAQLMSSAELALWTRLRRLRRADITAALWQERTLVKTSLMRMTLHLIPAGDFALYITALRHSRGATIRRILARLKVREADVDTMNQTVLQALSNGPMTLQELVQRVRAKAGKRMRKWLELAWSSTALRPTIIEGLICFGPPKGTRVTFTRVDQWLPPQPKLDPDLAKQMLLRRFLSAYGPATPHDFSKWSGLSMVEAKQAWQAVADEMAHVSVEGTALSLLRSDLTALVKSELDSNAVRLLPAFDPLLLAHVSKDHLVEPRFYKRVYRSQGWLSPVVLLGGKVVAVWSLTGQGKRLELTIEPFGRLRRAVRARLEAEAAELGHFLEAHCELRFSG